MRTPLQSDDTLISLALFLQSADLIMVENVTLLEGTLEQHKMSIRSVAFRINEVCEIKG